MELIARRKLAHDVSERLLEAIASKEYPPGSQLPSERELMARFGVGRPAIREALQVLHLIGMIRITHGERARVLVPTPTGLIEQISAAMVHLLASNPRGLSDLKESRLLFEVGVVRIATERATAEALDKLRQLTIDHREAKGDPARFVAIDMAFHRQIAAMTDNSLIAAVSHGILEWLAQFRRDMVWVRGRDRRVLEEHERIYKAIAAGDPNTAALAMMDHLNRASSVYAPPEEGNVPQGENSGSRDRKPRA